ncbi:MAG TPA: Lrp/AsnC ligand binding domain-containing protein [Gammaproteobacteria bacterium]
MVTAIILINAERNHIGNLAQRLADLDGISEVYSVSGRYDLVAIVRVNSNEDLATLVTHDMVKLDGIAHTETMLSFRAFSRHDLEEMFSIGM